MKEISIATRCHCDVIQILMENYIPDKIKKIYVFISEGKTWKAVITLNIVTKYYLHQGKAKVPTVLKSILKTLGK